MEKITLKVELEREGMRKRLFPPDLTNDEPIVY